MPKKIFKGVEPLNNPPPPVHGQPPPAPVKVKCIYCGKMMQPTRLTRWEDGTPMAYDAYTCEPDNRCQGLRKK